MNCADLLTRDVDLDATRGILPGGHNLAEALHQALAESVLLPGCQEASMHARRTAWLPVAKPLWVLGSPHLQRSCQKIFNHAGSTQCKHSWDMFKAIPRIEATAVRLAMPSCALGP